MPKFDQEIRSAILSAITQLGSQAELCKQTGISTSLMSRYCRGNAKSINMGTWKLLFPLIRPHLPPERRELLSYLPSRITPGEAAEVGLAIAPDEIEYTQPKSERENLLKLYDMLPKNKQRELFNIAVKLNLLEPLPGAVDPPEEKSKK